MSRKRKIIGFGPDRHELEVEDDWRREVEESQPKAGIEFARVKGFATIIARGPHPFIAEVTGFDPKYRYARSFLGTQNGATRPGGIIEIALRLTYAPLPRLFDIRADGQSFYCVYQSGSESVFGIYPIDELLLRELIQARELLKTSVGFANKLATGARKSAPIVQQSTGRIISFDE